MGFTRGSAILGTLEPGDRLLVSELSRLGRSLSQVIQIVETLVRRKIRFIAKILDVSRSALYHFIQTRNIAPG